MLLTISKFGKYELPKKLMDISRPVVNRFRLMSANRRTYYEILGQHRNATTNEIREAYLKMSKMFHPDISRGNGDSHKKFVEISTAYSVLSKPRSRYEYDLSLMSQRFHNGGNWSDNQRRSTKYPNFTSAHSQSKSSYRNDQERKASLYEITTNIFKLTITVTFLIASTVLLLNPGSGPGAPALMNGSPKIEYYSKEDLEKKKLLWIAEQYGMLVFYFEENNGTDNRGIIVACREKDEKSSEYRYRVLSSYSSNAKNYSIWSN